MSTDLVKPSLGQVLGLWVAIEATIVVVDFEAVEP
jgi:hypothetical protein